MNDQAEQVAAGKITQEMADSIIASLKEIQVNCDGTGSNGMGKSSGLKFVGNKNGNGMGKGQGGQGLALRDGSCYTNNK